jgi:hypothetical protein
LPRKYEALALDGPAGTPNECRFWIRPRRGFHGLQSDRERVTSAESGGDVQFRYTQKHRRLRALAGVPRAPTNLDYDLERAPVALFEATTCA